MIEAEFAFLTLSAVTAHTASPQDRSDFCERPIGCGTDGLL